MVKRQKLLTSKKNMNLGRTMIAKKKKKTKNPSKGTLGYSIRVIHSDTKVLEALSTFPTYGMTKRTFMVNGGEVYFVCKIKHLLILENCRYISSQDDNIHPRHLIIRRIDATWICCSSTGEIPTQYELPMP